MDGPGQVAIGEHAVVKLFPDGVAMMQRHGRIPL
jgi:hypothetical protein